MAERFPRYRPLGIRLTDAPRIDFAAAGATEAAGYRNLSDALNKISDFAFQEAGRRAKIEGEEFGYKLGKNPEQIKAALEAGSSVDDIVGDSGTIFGSASRAAVGAQLRVELENNVRSKLAQLSAAVEGGEFLDPADVETEIDAITEGHASLLSQIGGQYARQYRATVGTLAAPIYKSALEQSYKLRSAQISAEFESGIDDYKSLVYSIYDNDQGSQVEVDGQSMLETDVEYSVAARHLLDSALNTKNIPNVNRAKEVIEKFQAEAKVNAIRKFARENPDQISINLELFGNKTALYQSLDEDDKEKVRDEIREERAAQHTLEQRDITDRAQELEMEVNQILTQLTTKPHNDPDREKLVQRLEAIALTGRVKIDKDVLLSARNPEYRPPRPSSQRGINTVTRFILEERIRDIQVLNEQMAYNNVYGEEANNLRKEFFSVRKARENGVIELLKRNQKVFGPNVPTDAAQFIAKALPEIERMNEEANREIERDGGFPESFRKTAERYIAEGKGQAEIDERKSVRTQLKNVYQNKFPNFDFDNADATQVQELIDSLDSLGLRKRDENDIREGLQRLKDVLVR